LIGEGLYGLLFDDAESLMHPLTIVHKLSDKDNIVVCKLEGFAINSIETPQWNYLPQIGDIAYLLTKSFRNYNIIE